MNMSPNKAFQREMLIPFTLRSRLLGAVERLALYNDKGVAWSKHTDEQARTERARLTAKIQTLVTKLGKAILPPDFLAALKSGELSADVTGHYADVLKDHFSNASAI
ncbi:MAG: hypothetical protein ACT4OH_07620 [Methylophilaceae bacterium]